MYVEKLLSYIRGDITQLKDKNVNVGFSYLFLTFAGIDFLGGINQYEMDHLLVGR